MSDIAPFPALHYNPTAVSDLSEVIIPPYDNIPAGEEQKYFNRSPYNFAHVLLPKPNDTEYDHSKALLSQWMETGILTHQKDPSFYLYSQRFEVYGQKFNRYSLMCTVFLCDFAEGIVRPHENTFGQFKEDRLKILTKTQCNLSHIFGMVKDPEGYLNTLYEKWVYEKPLLAGKTDEGVEHAVWRISSRHTEPFVQFFKDKPIYIVDGHHRYESSVMYAKQVGAFKKASNPAAYMLFSISNAFDPALVVMPTHRVVRGITSKLSWAKIEERYETQKMDETDLRVFTRKTATDPSFALYWDGSLKRCTPKFSKVEGVKTYGKALNSIPVTWSDFDFLDKYCGVNHTNRSQHVSYEKDAEKTWKHRNEASLVVFHAPPSVLSVAEVADEKGFMPQKSTFFYPKLAAGLILRKLV